LRDLIQQRADEAGLGVRILFVGLQDIHPPVRIADAYEAVIGATQEREKTILDARGYAAEKTALATAEAARTRQGAQGNRMALVTRAQAASAAFTNQVAAFDASPRVYPRRLYLNTLVRNTAETRKYVVTSTNLQEAVWLNLEDKLRPDLLDITVPPAK
jgi:membrane protease subunit HflK